jgi:hypothetical protein
VVGVYVADDTSGIGLCELGRCCVEVYIVMLRYWRQETGNTDVYVLHMSDVACLE